MPFFFRRSAICCVFVLLYTATRAQSPEYASFRELDSITQLKRAQHHYGFANRIGDSLTRPTKLISLPSGDIQRGYSAQSPVCFDTAQRNFLQNPDYYIYVTASIRVASGHILVSGQIGDKGPVSNWSGFLMKTDEKGNFIWGKRYDSANAVKYSYFNFYSIVELPDGSIILGGSTWNNVTENDDVVLMKTDANGNPLWNRIYRSPYWQQGDGSADFFYIQDMKADPSTGDIYVCGPLWAKGRTLTRFDGNGNISWSKVYQSWNGQSDRVFGINIRNSDIEYYGTLLGSGYLMNRYRINKTNGDTIQTRTLFHPGGNVKPGVLIHEPVVLMPNGNVRLGGKAFGSGFSFDSISRYQATMIELDDNFNPVIAVSLKNNLWNNAYHNKMTINNDGSWLYIMIYGASFSANVYAYQVQDDLLLKERRLEYRGVGLPTDPITLRDTHNRDLIIKTAYDSATILGKIEFLKISAADTSSACAGFNENISSIEKLPMVPYNFPVQAIFPDAFVPSTNKTIRTRDLTYSFALGCQQVSYCNTLSLLPAKDTLCVTDSLQLTIRKNIACGSAVPLSYDTAAVSSIRWENDTTVIFRFKATWSGFIRGTIGGCTIIRDSVRIVVLQAMGPVSLGNDRGICPGNTITLNARAGYKQYLWQDGTTDSTYIVTSPGQYHVAVTDACGAIYRDTIFIAAAPPIPFDLGPDRTKCNSDTVRLVAPPGFLNYTWSNNYNISSTSGQQVIVNPLVDTAYYVRAEKTPGCFAFDTIRIDVNQSPLINLGNDTSFCDGQSVLLNAGGGFVNYTWSTGQTTAVIEVSNTGVYHVRATTPEGCTSYDTLRVLSLFANPVVSLNKDPELCINSSRTLNAGVHARYLWQDGSTGSSLTVSGTGKYSVRVWNSNGCTAADSTVITTILPSPAGFLGADTAICSYGKMVLLPTREYNTYSWNTNATTRDLTINKAGTYWLRVTDAKGCSGYDTIIVELKQCMKGLHVPNAFTPNQDGKNDELRALLFGDVVMFEFLIYNRYGQVVFRTNDPLKGWNGMVGGRPQDSNTYLWTCKYQLEGEAVRVEKGVVVLVR